MTVGELIAELQKHPSDLEVVVRTENLEGDSFCGGVGTVTVDSGCTDTDALMIDCFEEDPDES